MTEPEIKHFLLIADPAAPEAVVRDLGADYDAAIVAYNDAEEKCRGTDVEVVLLSADSVETVRSTHSSYFAMQAENPIDTVLAGRCT